MATAPEIQSHAWRLFIALPIPVAARDQLSAQLEPYVARHPEARWIDPGSWHVTLLFLGSVASDRIGAVIDLVAGVGEGQAQFELVIGRGGGHRSRRGSAAWLGIGDGASEVIALADALRARCPDDLTLGARPRRTQTAHLTVARRVDETTIRALREAAWGPLTASWTADRITVYRSVLSPAGATYESLSQVGLLSR